MKNAILITKLCNAVLKSYRNYWPRDLVKIFTCSSLDFYAQTMTWDCGYRNVQTILSCCLESDCYTRQHVFVSMITTVPSLVDLQKNLEKAWGKGYDQIGGMQLNYFLLDTYKWIGATEIVALLRFYRIRASIADFDYNNNHCDLNAMIMCVSEYFKSRCATKYHMISPLYLQHQGHSRLILGIEEWVNGNTKLLVLDPQMRKALQFYQKQGEEANILRQSVSTHGLNSKSKYQLAYLSQKKLCLNEGDYLKIIIDELRHPKLKIV